MVYVPTAIARTVASIGPTAIPGWSRIGSFAAANESVLGPTRTCWGVLFLGVKSSAPGRGQVPLLNGLFFTPASSKARTDPTPAESVSTQGDFAAFRRWIMQAAVVPRAIEAFVMPAYRFGERP